MNSHFRPYSVLVADDDPTVALLAQVALPAAEFSTTVVASGDAAIERFARQPFDIVLLDVEMPGCDGIDACREIRRSNAAVPVLLVTGRNDPAFLALVKELGVEHIAKPVDWGSLAALIRRRFGR